MEACTIETGLLRKKPCGHAGVAHCANCEQPLCAQHAIAQLTEAGKKSGKFMCQECVAAAKEHDKSIAAAARSQQEKKVAASYKAAVDAANAPAAAPKKPAAPPAPGAAAAAPGAAAAKPAEASEPDALEFTPKDGKFGYTPKKDDGGFKPE